MRGLLAAAVLALLAGAAMAEPLRVGVLSGASAPSFAHLMAAFREGLEREGFVEGDALRIDYRWAEGDYGLLPALAAELAALAPAVILTSGGDRPTLAAKAAAPGVPIVCAGSDGPVRFGLVESLARPGGDLTGAAMFTSEVEIKKLELLRDALPEARRIAMLVNPENPAADEDARAVEAAAAEMGFALDLFEAGSADGLAAAFAELARDRHDGLLIGHDPWFNSERAAIVAHANALAVPAVYEHRAFVEAGGLMSYGSVIDDNYRKAGEYVGRILKGAKPADLPVWQPTRFELVLNLGAAEALGLVFPAAVLIRADDVVE